MEYFRVGRLLSTHGLKGEMKLQVITDFDRFFSGSRLYIGYNNEYIEVIVKEAKDYKNSLLITFKDLDDINLVEKYRNSYLYISKKDQGDLTDMYYFHELIGKKIINQDGVLRGVCEDIEEVPQGHNLVFSIDSKKKRVPFIMGVFIKEVNEDSIIINEIEGLF
jgi:16S rRNA processing protein RimM